MSLTSVSVGRELWFPVPWGRNTRLLEGLSINLREKSERTQSTYAQAECTAGAHLW